MNLYLKKNVRVALSVLFIVVLQVAGQFIVPDTIYLEPGESTTITAAVGDINEWTGPGGFSASNVKTITVSPTEDSWYEVINYGEVAILNENAGFELPDISPAGTAQLWEADVPGWKTTATGNNKKIELWRDGHKQGAEDPVPSYSGKQFAELNCREVADLYQDIPTTPGRVVSISFAHRGRAWIDKMEVKAGPVGGPYTVLGEYSDGKDKWGFYRVNYLVPDGQTSTRIFFSSATYNLTSSVGNFLDAVAYTEVFETGRDSVLVKVIDIPTVVTSVVNGISETSAVGGGNVTSDGGDSVTVRGVCWGTSPTLDTSNNVTKNGSGTGVFNSNINGLTSGATYYVRAYAINSYGIAYGDVVSFKTKVLDKALLNVTPADTVYAADSIKVTLSSQAGNIIVYELLNFDSTVVSGPDTINTAGTITVIGDMLLKATASGTGYKDNSGMWFYDSEIPQLSIKSSLLSGSHFQVDTTVYLHAEVNGVKESGVKIYYVVDYDDTLGFPDSTNGTLYDSTKGIALEATANIYAVAYKDGFAYGMNSWTYILDLLNISITAEPSDPVVYYFGESLEKISVSTTPTENITITWILDTVEYTDTVNFSLKGSIYNDTLNYPSIDSGSSDTVYLSVMATGKGYTTAYETFKYVRLYLPEIVADPVSGTTFSGELSVALNVADPDSLFENLQIYYVITTEGAASVDSGNSSYAKGVDIDATTYIKAIAYADNAVTSPVFTGYYIHTVVSGGAWYKDLDGNGFIDAATINLSADPLSLIDSQVVLPDSIVFEDPFSSGDMITAGSDDITVSGSVITVALPEDFTVSGEINTRFETGLYGQLFGSYYSNGKFGIGDSVAPVITKAFYMLGKVYSGGDSIIRDPDTLVVTFSEEVLASSITEGDKSRFFDLLDKKNSAEYYFDLSVLKANGRYVQFIVDGITGSEYPVDGDSIRINASDSIAAENGEVVQAVEDNRYCVLQVISKTIDPEIKVIGPLDPDEYVIPDELKGEDITAETGMPIVIDFLIPLTEDIVEKLDMKVVIMDCVGNVVARTNGKDDNGRSEIQVTALTTDKTMLVAVWSGANSKRRMVGGGSYLMIISHVASDGEGWVEKSLMLNVKD